MTRMLPLVAGLGMILVTAPVLAQRSAKTPSKPEAVSKSDKPAPTPDSATDLAAIRATSAAFVEAFNKRDAKAVAALWTQDGDYVDDAGRTYKGRAEIAKVYSAFFAENP